MQLFVVDNKDFTMHIKVPSYKVNDEDIYEEWEDSDYNTHRDITRTRVSGDFTLLYDDVDELDDFFDTINTLKESSDNGAIEMTVYCNNTHSVKTITAFIKYEPANEKPFFGKEKVSGFSVTIKEQ